MTVVTYEYHVHRVQSSRVRSHRSRGIVCVQISRKLLLTESELERAEQRAQLAEQYAALRTHSYCTSTVSAPAHCALDEST